MSEDTLRAIQFRDTVALLAQQKESRFRSSVMVKTDAVGKMTTMDQVEPRTAKKKLARFEKLNIDGVDYQRRVIFPQTYFDNPGIDPDDKLNWVADPQASLVKSVSAAIGRAMDEELASKAIGTAFVGEDGTTSEALPSSQKIAVASAGLTVAKLRTAKAKLDGNDVDGEDRFIWVHSQQVDNLLGDSNVTSIDTNTVRALVNGEVNQFLGFTFIRAQRLTNTSTTRHCVAFQRLGIGLAVWQEIVGRIDERKDAHYAKQIYFRMRFGASRLEKSRVVQVDCLES
jgi:hypothetical protein